MNGLAQVAALLAAVVYIGASPLEMFFYHRPWARRFLHVDTRHVDNARMWAFCVGARNLLAGVGAVIGLVMLRAGTTGEGVAIGRSVVLTACWYMLLASLAMGVADLLGHWRPRGGSVLGTISSSVLPLVAIIAAWG